MCLRLRLRQRGLFVQNRLWGCLEPEEAAASSRHQAQEAAKSLHSLEAAQGTSLDRQGRELAAVYALQGEE